MTKAIFAIALAMIVSACTHSAARVTCPPLKEYSDRTRQKIAADIRAIKGKYPALEGFIVDSAKLRTAVRTCKSHREKQRK